MPSVTSRVSATSPLTASMHDNPQERRAHLLKKSTAGQSMAASRIAITNGMKIVCAKYKATVTVCHSRSRNLAEITRSADIVVVAIGQARFLKADMIRPGAVVIDVGMNRGTDGKLCGDVDFDAVKEVASAITPVPGGVGPMTITMLLHNTLAAARLQVMDRS